MKNLMVSKYNRQLHPGVAVFERKHALMRCWRYWSVWTHGLHERRRVMDRRQILEERALLKDRVGVLQGMTKDLELDCSNVIEQRDFLGKEIKKMKRRKSISVSDSLEIEAHLLQMDDSFGPLRRKKEALHLFMQSSCDRRLLVDAFWKGVLASWEDVSEGIVALQRGQATAASSLLRASARFGW